MTTKAPWQEPLADDLKRLGMRGTARDVLQGKVSMNEALAHVGHRIAQKQPLNPPGSSDAKWYERAQNVIDGYQADGLGGDLG